MSYNIIELMDEREIAKYGEGVPFIIEIHDGTKLKICFEETGMMDCKGCVFELLNEKCWDVPCVYIEREDGLTGRYVEVKE